MQKQFTESDLIRDIQDRSAQGLEALYDRYAALLYKILWSVVRDRTIAEKLLEEVLLTIADQIHTYPTQELRFTLWMASIAKRLPLLESSEPEIIPETLPVISNSGIQFSFNNLTYTMTNEEKNPRRDFVKKSLAGTIALGAGQHSAAPYYLP